MGHHGIPGHNTLALTGVTFTDNRAVTGAGQGGAISSGPTLITLNACTLHSNQAVSGGGIFLDAPGSTIGTVTAVATDWGNSTQGTSNSPDDLRLGGGAGWTVNGTPSFVCTARYGASTCN